MPLRFQWSAPSAASGAHAPNRTSEGIPFYFLIVFYINKNLLIQKGNETAKKVRQNFHLGCFVTGEPNITSIGLFFKNVGILLVGC